jgi:hypothetical protein
MTRRDWSSGTTLAAYDDGLADGIEAGARELMELLIRKGISNGDWNGGDVVEVVDQWLQDHGVNTELPDDEEEEEDEEE